MYEKAQVWVVTQTQPQKFLLLKTTEKRGGFWQSVTGKVESGESIEQGAARELKEETGIEGQLQPIGYDFEFEGKWGRAHETAFLCQIPDTVEIAIDPKEHVEFTWVEAAEAKKMLKFDSNLKALEIILKHV